MRLPLLEALRVVWVSDDRRDAATTVRIAHAALRGGVRAVILREPRLDDAGYRELVARLAPAFTERGAWLIGHERPGLVGRCAVDGWHRKSALLRADAGSPVSRASDGVFGVSTHSAAELARAAELGASYALLGSVLATTSHPGAPFHGRAEAARIAGTARMPVVAIGGIHAGCAGGWREAGFAGIACSSAIGAASDPEGAARELVRTTTGEASR